MPLLTFDLIEGRTEQEVKTLLDAAHRAVLRAFEVPNATVTRLFMKTKPTIW
ncbi:4-oxalocrotonate tautomerase [Klebsiella pneumoniae]|nr:4-oxalocrotonate tautomerase [Klebsiella pneumoniae]